MAKPYQLPNGKWRIQWTNCDRIRQSLVLNSKKDAEIILKQKETEAYQIKNQLIARPLEVMTFDNLCEYWIKYKVPNKRSGHHDYSIIKNHLQPFLSGLRLD